MPTSHPADCSLCVQLMAMEIEKVKESLFRCFLRLMHLLCCLSFRQKEKTCQVWRQCSAPHATAVEELLRGTERTSEEEVLCGVDRLLEWPL